MVSGKLAAQSQGLISICCLRWHDPWWLHQMETFSTLLALCTGNSPVTGEFPSQRPVMQSFDIFFYLCLNKQLSKQSRRQWFEKPWRSLWCHCNVKVSRDLNHIIHVCIFLHWKRTWSCDPKDVEPGPTPNEFEKSTWLDGCSARKT